jgi:hypothetical protein
MTFWLALVVVVGCGWAIVDGLRRLNDEVHRSYRRPIDRL